MTLNTLTDWLQLLASEDRSYAEGETSVYIYGEGDSAYAVVETQIKKSPRTIVQYVINAADGSNKLYSLINFLKDSDFDIRLAVQKLTQANYISDQANDVADFGIVKAYRYELQENTNS